MDDAEEDILDTAMGKAEAYSKENDVSRSGKLTGMVPCLFDNFSYQNEVHIVKVLLEVIIYFIPHRD